MKIAFPFILCVSFFLVSAKTLHAGNLVHNGGCDGPFHDGIASGWVKNCYGINDVTFSRSEPHAGAASQKVTCARFESGAVQFYLPVKLEAGKYYRVTAWMRADGGVGSVLLGLRQGPAPYRMHLSDEFEPGRQWRRFSFEGRCGGSEAVAGLFVKFEPAGPGSLWIDDVEVIETEPPKLDLPVPARNVVPNGSFEVATTPDWRSRKGRMEIVQGDAFHGDRALRLRLDAGSDRLFSRPVVFGPDERPFRLSFGAKANGEATVSVRVWSAMSEEKPLLALNAKPRDAWKVFEKTAVLEPSPNGAYYFEIGVNAKEEATVSLDAVCLSPETAGFSTRRDVEASLSCARPNHAFRIGEPVEMICRAFAGRDGVESRALVCRISDYHRRTVQEIPVEVDFAAGPGVGQALRVDLEQTGVFLAELMDGEETLSAVSFSILPPPADVSAEESSLGGHFRLDDFHLRAARTLGIRWTRIHDCEHITHWKTVQPEKGRFVWFDEKVTVARRHGVKVLGEFMRTPGWASSRKDAEGGKPFVSPPEDWDAFAAYVRAAVDHYRDDITHWEIWNEPYHDGFWTGTVDEFVRLAKIAARETRAANAKATIVSPCAYPGIIDWEEEFIAGGGLKDVDVLAYHGYSVFNTSGYERVRKWAASGRTTPRPIWNTETGVPSTTFYRHIPDKYADSYTAWLRPREYDVAAEHAAKYYIMAMAGDAKRFFYYWCVYEDTLLPRLSAFSIFEYDGSFRPCAVSYAVAGSILDGTKGERWIKMPGPVVANLFSDETRQIAVIWREGGREPREIFLDYPGDDLRVLGIMGNRVVPKRDGGGIRLSVSGEPVYLIVPKASGERLKGAIEGCGVASNRFGGLY